RIGRRPDPATREQGLEARDGEEGTGAVEGEGLAAATPARHAESPVKAGAVDQEAHACSVSALDPYLRARHHLARERLRRAQGGHPHERVLTAELGEQVYGEGTGDSPRRR